MCWNTTQCSSDENCVQYEASNVATRMCYFEAGPSWYRGWKGSLRRPEELLEGFERWLDTAACDSVWEYVGPLSSACMTAHIQ